MFVNYAIDDIIGREKFCDLMKDIASGEGPTDEAIYEEFDRFDVNKDGTVDKDEFRELCINIF